MWTSFFEKLPEHGQKIYYYGEVIGVWQGRYEFHPDDSFSPHLMFCEEGSIGGVVDRMDAPWWMPYDGQPKPAKPNQDYPEDYPK